MENIISQAEEKMQKAIESMEKKFTNIRAGRANPAVLDGIKVPYYEVDTPLIQLATISVPEARTISIRPFDRSTIASIEKAIFEADLGLTPANNGETININFPPLTEDRRKDYVKQVKSIAEEGHIALRTIRQDANNSIKKLELPEDEENHGMARIQDLVNMYNKEIDEKLKLKEQELMSI